MPATTDLYAGRTPRLIVVAPFVSMVAYYDRDTRSWWAYYLDARTGDQLGDAWFGATRDEVLVFRPDTPVVPAEAAL
jgi:hypothetical protein